MTAGIIAGFLAFGVGPVHAANVPGPADLPSPPIDLAKCCGPFHCEAYLEVAAVLQALPEEQRVAQLRAWAEARDLGRPALAEQVVALCRMLFEPKPGQPFRASSLATPEFLGPENDYWPDYGIAQSWPLAPITLVDGIPFAVVSETYPDAGWDHISFPQSLIDIGMKEIIRPDAGVFLDYCLKDTQWSTHRYAPATAEALNGALDQLLNRHPWPRPLNEDQRKFLTEQIIPFTPLPLWITGVMVSANNRGNGWIFDRVESTHDNHKAITFGGVGRVSLTIEVSVNGGTRPYRYIFTRQGTGETQPSILAQGRGQEGVFNPFSKEKFPLRCYQPEGGDRSVFKLVDDEGEQAIGSGDQLLLTVVDAQGTKQARVLQVTGAGEIAIFQPGTDLPAHAPTPTRPALPSS